GSAGLEHAHRGSLFLRERVRLPILDELGNFIDSESGRILLAAASWLKTFMMQIAIPVVALGAGETVYRARVAPRVPRTKSHTRQHLHPLSETQHADARRC